MRMFAFARANQMLEHKFTDDVALTRAWTRKGAIKKFNRYYSDVQKDEVEVVRVASGIEILTDY